MPDTYTSDEKADTSESTASQPVTGSRTDRLQEFLDAPRRALWIMALPMIAGMAVHTMYIVADTAFIGSLGTDELAAATFVAPLFFLMIALTMGTRYRGHGGGGSVGRSRRQRRRRCGRRYGHQLGPLFGSAIRWCWAR